MPRYIDLDKIPESAYWCRDALVEAFENADIVDAVEVIRCKDCQRFVGEVWLTGSGSVDVEGHCGLTGIRVMPHDFCSYAIREKMPKTEFDRTINASDLQEWIIEAFPDWCEGAVRVIYDHIDDMPSAQPEITKYEYHYDHTDCIWYRPEARNRCPTTCAQYRDGWNDAMNYIFRDGKGYRPYRRDKQYGE